jgi:triphosphatase
METELKLAYDSLDELLAVQNQDWFIGVLLPDIATHQRFVNSYYDTEDHALRTKGAMVRVRDIEGNGFVHTVKSSAGNKDGLHQRFEWNYETDDEIFDAVRFLKFAELCNDPFHIIEDILLPVSNVKLSCMFQTVFERISYMVGYGNSIIELSLDYGKINVMNRTEDICEMEIELVEGDVRDVISLGQVVLSNSICRTENRSKYSRCFDLLNGGNSL